MTSTLDTVVVPTLAGGPPPGAATLEARDVGAWFGDPQDPFVTAGIIERPGKKSAAPSKSGTTSAAPSATLSTSTMTAEADDLANGGSQNWREADPGRVRPRRAGRFRRLGGPGAVRGDRDAGRGAGCDPYLKGTS